MKATSLTSAVLPSRRKRTMKRASLCLLVVGSAAAACRDRASGPTTTRLDPASRFAGYTKTCGDVPRAEGGIPGEIPREYLAKYTGAAGGTTSRQQLYPTGSGYDAKKIIDGLCTWYLWQGGDPATYDGRPDTGGNPHFWRALERRPPTSARRPDSRSWSRC